jgi:ppGpp synthetase/RelA/SpoT-type nucleotidyltranferase
MNHPTPIVIEEFLTEYAIAEPGLKLLAEQLREEIKNLLETHRIMAIVTSRAKEQDRLKAKLERMHQKEPFRSTEDIWKKLHDLVGTRIALYFPSDVESIPSVLEEKYKLSDDKKKFPAEIKDAEKLENRGYCAYERRIYPGYAQRRFDGYCANHFYFEHVSDLSGGRKMEIEVQVASVLMHAWSEVEHDLAYKKMSGAVSAEEYACLDEINGLVIAGEIALNRLKRLSAQRARSMSKLETALNLKDYLVSWLREQNAGKPLPVQAEQANNVNRLFQIYEDAEMLTSSYLEYRLKSVENPDSLSDLVRRLIDRCFDDKYSVAKQVTVTFLLESRKENTFYSAGKLNNYLGKWNSLEAAVRKAVRSTNRVCPNMDASRKYLSEEPVLQDSFCAEYIRLRTLRDQIVHEGRLPEQDAFRQSIRDMEALTKDLKNEYNLK